MRRFTLNEMEMKRQLKGALEAWGELCSVRDWDNLAKFVVIGEGANKDTSETS